MYVKRKSFERF